jgi:chorismate-pyruvate lyase
LTAKLKEQKPLSDASFHREIRKGSGQTNGVLVLAFYYPPENESGAQRAFRFVKYLRKQGYLPQVVTRHKPGGQCSDHVHATPAPGSEGALVKVAESSIRLLERTILPYSDQLPWVPAATATARRTMAGHPFSAVLSTSPPAGSHLVAARLKREFRVPWIADFRDPLSGNPFRTARWGKLYDAVLEKMIVRQADVVIANTDTFADTLRRRYPHWAHKVHLIWNGFDPEEPVLPLPLPERERKVLLHAGSIYGGRHPGLLLKSLSRMIARRAIELNQLQVRLIGHLETAGWSEGADFPALLQAGWVECVERLVPLADARREMALADYLLLLDLNELGTGTQVPAKLFEYIQIGRPILAFTVRDSAASRILAQAGISHTCVYITDSEGEVDRKIATFLSKAGEQTSPSEWFQRNFNAQAQTEELTHLLASVTRQ